MELEKNMNSVNENSGSQGNLSMVATEVEAKTLADEFLEAHYEFRRNVLRGCTEYRKIGEENWIVLTKEAVKSILLKSVRELGDDIDIKPEIRLYVVSDEPQLFDPINDWLTNLPEWDGNDRVVDFWKRIPGITADQIYFMSIYHRSVVAHWLGMDSEHGNECVPVLIGAQGARKSTFVLQFLPPHLRQYYLDHFNLANKFDKDMALTNCLIINLDEMDKYSAKQMAEIKASLSKVEVNARNIYGRTIECKRRYASFFATTNCEMPLTDPTGSRRFICIRVPNGRIIDVETAIEYEQLYAQILHELKVGKMRYWFNDDETSQIQALNTPFQRELDLNQMLSLCYRHAKDDEEAKQVGVLEIQQHLHSLFPAVAMPQISTVKIGKAMKAADFVKTHTRKGSVYPVVEI